MVHLRPGADAKTTLAALEDAARTAESIAGAGGSAIDRLGSYRLWSSQQVRSLSTHITPTSLDEILTTRRHWLIQSIDPVAYGHPAVGELVDTEVTACVDALHSAIRELSAQMDRWSTWRGSGIPGIPFHAVVLDTNVLLQHHADLTDIEWNVGLNVFPHEPIGLGVPIVVVEELDRHKNSNGVMHIGNEKVPLRSLARAALRTLDQVFNSGYLNQQIRDRESVDGRYRGRLEAILIIDDYRYTRLPEADAEIIDQAVRLQPFTARTAIATYDQAMIFRARSAGVIAFTPAVSRV